METVPDYHVEVSERVLMTEEEVEAKLKTLDYLIKITGGLICIVSFFYMSSLFYSCPAYEYGLMVALIPVAYWVIHTSNSNNRLYCMTMCLIYAVFISTACFVGFKATICYHLGIDYFKVDEYFHYYPMDFYLNTVTYVTITSLYIYIFYLYFYEFNLNQGYDDLSIAEYGAIFGALGLLLTGSVVMEYRHLLPLMLKGIELEPKIVYSRCWFSRFFLYPQKVSDMVWKHMKID